MYIYIYRERERDNSSLAHPTHHPEGPLLKRERRKGETVTVREREKAHPAPTLLLRMARVVVAAGADTGEETPGRIYLPQRLAKPRLAGDGATAHLAGHPPAGVSPP